MHKHSTKYGKRIIFGLKGPYCIAVFFSFLLLGEIRE